MFCFVLFCHFVIDGKIFLPSMTCQILLTPWQYAKDCNHILFTSIIPHMKKELGLVYPL